MNPLCYFQFEIVFLAQQSIDASVQFIVNSVRSVYYNKFGLSLNKALCIRILSIKTLLSGGSYFYNLSSKKQHSYDNFLN